MSANAHTRKCSCENESSCPPFSSHHNNSHDCTISSTQSNRHFATINCTEKKTNRPMPWFLFSIIFSVGVVVALISSPFRRCLHESVFSFCYIRSSRLIVHIHIHTNLSNRTHHHYELTHHHTHTHWFSVVALKLAKSPTIL